jgi:CubicO group peptidase (beta-lactamase class C family)
LPLLKSFSDTRRLRVGGAVVAVVVAVWGVAGIVSDAPADAAEVAAQTGPVLVDDSKLAEVERYLEARRAELGLPGMAAAIVQGDEVVLLRGFGEARPDGALVGPDTPFLIASLSKSMAALAVMQLVEQGTVDPAAPVTTHLPELGPGGDAISVLDLMHHRSGLTTYVGVEPFWDEELESSLEANVARLGPLFAEDASFEYSNANYDAMALLVERVSGLAFADYLEQRVFEPLGMYESSVDVAAASASGLAQGHYHWALLGYRPHDPVIPVSMPGSHTMFSTAEDLSHLLIAHLNGGTYRDNSIVTAESLDALHQPRPYGPETGIGYAGGWTVFPPHTPGMPEGIERYATLAHDGSSVSYRAMMWFMPGADLGFVVLANGNDDTDQSFLPQVAWNVQLLLFDLEPLPIEGRSDLITTWRKHLLLLVVIGQMLLALAVVKPLRRIRRGDSPGMRGWVALVAATVLDLVALFVIVVVIPWAAFEPLRAVRDLPDYRLLIFAMLVGIAWGAVRTLLVARWLSGHRPGHPTAPASEPAVPVG